MSGPPPAGPEGADDPGSLLEPSEFLTPVETMRLLRIGRTAFYSMLANGEVPGASKLGSLWRVHRPTLIASMTCQPSSSREDNQS